MECRHDNRDELRRRRRGRLLSIGIGIGAGIISGRALRREDEPFSVGMAFGVGPALLVASAFGESLVEDTSEIAKGASLVRGLAGWVA